MRSRAKRAAALAVDAMVGALAPIVMRGRLRGVIPPSPRVLLIRCDHIGDAAMATAVLRPLRDALRPATLDVLAGPWSASLFEGHPAVDRVLTYATPWWSAARGAPLRKRVTAWAKLPSVVRRVRAGRYDVGIDLRGDLRQIVCFLGLGGMPVRASSDRTGARRLLTHVWQYHASLHEVEKNFAVAALLGAAGRPRLDVVVRPDLPEQIRAMLSGHAMSGGYVAFALRGLEPNRAWPASHAATVVDALRRELGLASVYVGTSADGPLGDAVAQLAESPVVNLAGRTSLAEVLTVLRNAIVTIAVDSGPMHLAAAAGSPVVALFGPGDPRECRPWSDAAHVVTTGAPCGCVHPRCDFTVGPGRCMGTINPQAVLAAVKAIVATKVAGP